MRKALLVIAVALLSISVAAPSFAKKQAIDKDAADAGAHKTVALGPVDMNQMEFSRMSPDATAELFRSRIKRALEDGGRFTVITADFKRGQGKAPEAENVENAPQPKNMAEAMKAMQKMQAEMQKTMAQMRGEYVHEPVAADALFTFNVSGSTKRLDTGGIVGTALDLGAPSQASAADVSSEKQLLTLTCVERDPQKGSILDEHEAKASSTRYAKVGGSYVLDDTTDPEKAYDRLFKRAAKNCVKWIEEKMAARP
ncbi:MAG: hypothetical protein WC956_02715 [bacterium]